MVPHVLVVDDDDDIRELLKEFLIHNQYAVSIAADVATARRLLKEFEFDLIIMDIMMPDEDGLSYLASPNVSTPVILISALSDVDDKINGLKKGAEDYLSKPFDPRELLVRVEKVLSRKAKSSGNEVPFGDYTFNVESERLQKGKEEINLTATEVNLLKNLIKQIGKAVTREILASSEDAQSLRAVDTQMVRLRSKLEKDPKNPKYFLTIRGKGYMLKA
jgi:two-component system, OmpR family, phosphate regulon response regulator OmpR